MHAVSSNTTHKQPSIIPDNWEKAKDSFTSDDLIDAYEKGKKKGLSMQEEINMKMFNLNLGFATEVAEEFFEFLQKSKHKPVSVKLRPNSIVSFDIAIIVNSTSYFSDKFDQVYDAAYRVRNENSTDTLKIYFYFIPQTETLDNNLMVSDGFVLSYEPKVRQSTSRTRKTQ